MRRRNRVGGRLERTSYMSSYVSEEMQRGTPQKLQKAGLVVAKE